jgi:hypothetical protein
MLKQWVGPACPAAGIYFRLLLLGCFESIDSERTPRITRRLSRTRRLIDLETRSGAARGVAHVVECGRRVMYARTRR